MFLGREKELHLLKENFEKSSFVFGVIHGRRRVGKTTLLKESIHGYRSLYLLAQQANIKTNLDLFNKRYGELLGNINIKYDSFYELFEAIFKEKNLIVIIDEFSYLTEVDSSIESILQGLIDTYKDQSQIKLIISGSEIGMFENHFSVSKPLFNRQTFSYHLKECDYLESSLYYPSWTPEDKVRAYAVFGGLPYYLAQIDDTKTLEDNIKYLITKESAIFSNEVTMLLHTELRNVQEYQSVLQAIHSGSTKLFEIDSKSRILDTAKTSKYVNKLIQLEIIEKEFKFFDTPNSKNHLFRIKSNFVAFHYHFIWKNQASRALMTYDDFYDTFIKDELDLYVSRRFEKIAEQYLIKNYKMIHGEPIIQIGRYWHNDRRLKKDIEIDICVQTKNHIHIYECKWTNKVIQKQTMDDLIIKGTFLQATKYGAFFKHGFDKMLLEMDYDFIDTKALFD